MILLIKPPCYHVNLYIKPPCCLVHFPRGCSHSSKLKKDPLCAEKLFLGDELIKNYKKWTQLCMQNIALLDLIILLSIFKSIHVSLHLKPTIARGKLFKN